MPNLYNVHEGTAYYNYATPIVKGVSYNELDNLVYNLFSQIFAYNVEFTGSTNNFGIKFPAPGLEGKVGNVTSWNGAIARFTNTFGISHDYSFINTSLDAVTTTPAGSAYWDSRPYPGYKFAPTDKIFAFVNQYAFCLAAIGSTDFTPKKFFYCGWLREPAFENYPNSLSGAVLIEYNGTTLKRAIRPLGASSTSSIVLSTANNSITNTPIVCENETVGADATDIIVRESAAPNIALGKLYNCVSLPNSAPLGSIWRNNGLDPETNLPHSTNTLDKYIVVLQWGGRKLGMRIWTENYA